MVKVFSDQSLHGIEAQFSGWLAEMPSNILKLEWRQINGVYSVLVWYEKKTDGAELFVKALAKQNLRTLEDALNALDMEVTIKDISYLVTKHNHMALVLYERKNLIR